LELMDWAKGLLWTGELPSNMIPYETFEYLVD